MGSEGDGKNLSCVRGIKDKKESAGWYGYIRRCEDLGENERECWGERECRRMKECVRIALP